MTRGSRSATGSYFTYDVIMQCETSRSRSASACMFGQSTLVADGNHRFRDLTKPILEQGYDFRPIRIEDDATIHSKCTIINSIGTRALIGANGVVSQRDPRLLRRRGRAGARDRLLRARRVRSRPAGSRASGPSAVDAAD